MEIFKDIEGYEGKYQISNQGRVKRFYKNGKEKILKPSKDDNGYYRVNLGKDGKIKTVKIHRLIAEAFIPNPENKPCIDHIIPLSIGGTNEVSNLRWCTHMENLNNSLTIVNFKNKIITDETKRKMSESRKGMCLVDVMKKHLTNFKNKMIKEQIKETYNEH